MDSCTGGYPTGYNPEAASGITPEHLQLAFLVLFHRIMPPHSRFNARTWTGVFDYLCIAWVCGLKVNLGYSSMHLK
jgi:hypothetical protein